MIIDFHAHIYPEKIAAKASDAISTFYDGAPMRWHGSSAELIESGSKAGVTNYVVHSAATTPAQVEIVNNFILKECDLHPEFIGFGTLHPEYENFEAELKRIKEAGLKGVKLHPDFQKFELDDPAMDKMYAKLAELRIPVLFHAGDCRFSYSGPRRIRNVIDKFPELMVIAAHFGGYTEWEDSLNYLAGTNCYFDTSSTFWKLSYDKAQELMDKHGYEKFFFGSDFPMWDHEGELERLKNLKLTEEQLEAILYKNAQNFLKNI